MRVNRSLSELVEIQVQNEIEMKSIGIQRMNREIERAISKGVESDTIYYRRLIKNVVQPMSEGIDAFLTYFENKRGRHSAAVPMLRMLDTRESAYIAIKTLLDCLSKGFEIRKTTELIGRRIEDQIRFSVLTEKAPGYIAKIEDSLKKNNTDHYEHKRKVYVSSELKIHRRNGLKLWHNWPDSTIRQVGAMLIDIFEKSVTLNGKPLIYKYVKRSNQKGTYKTLATINPTEELVEWINSFKKELGCISPAYGPCVIPPKKRTGPYKGGYHVPEIASTMPITKCRASQLTRLTNKQMPKVYKAVNYFQSIKWRVNLDILSVVNTIVDNQIDLAMPQRDPYVVSTPPLPKEAMNITGPALKAVLTDSEYNDFLEWKKEATRTYLEENSRRSSFAAVVRTIGQANKYRSFEELYFVYKTDSRGRYYPVGDALTPIGDDLQKALLEFVEEKPLSSTLDSKGRSNRDWFCIIGANLWGADKLPFKERIQFVKDNDDFILDIATDPLMFKDWAKADKPWQFLAWAFEYKKLRDYEDEHDTFVGFTTRLRGGMDGSCSGIQHYSMMLRDHIGGAAVNLTCSDRPQDIYARVAEVAEMKMKIDSMGTAGKDEPNDTDYAIAWLSIQGGISRSLTKKSVMTLPYGSTMITCREAIQAHLEKLVKDEKALAKLERRNVRNVHPFGDYLPMKEALSYATRIVWQSIKEVVVAATEAMDFIQKIASRVARTNNKLEWVTPTGFIVEQRIYETEYKKVYTKMFGATTIWIPEETDIICERKMKSSSAPNFIHSYDASHVTYMCVREEELGHTMNCIHDDFETHICNIPSMRDELKDTMIDLYQDNELKKFLNAQEERLMIDFETDLPSFGKLTEEDVRQSDYAFA